MIKRFLSIVVVATILTSCGNSGSKQEKSKDPAGTDTTATVEFASLIETPDDFLNKEISIDGQVVHVCKHTGKKMFIVGENPDIRLFISAGEEVPLFEQELLGSEITVSGFLTKVEAGEKEMGMGEGEHEGVAEGEEMSGKECETEAAVEAQPVLADFVLQYRSHKVK